MTSAFTVFDTMKDWRKHSNLNLSAFSIRLWWLWCWQVGEGVTILPLSFTLFCSTSNADYTFATHDIGWAWDAKFDGNLTKKIQKPCTIHDFGWTLSLS